VDAVKIPCGNCGGPASRIPDVGNPWLDAGIVPYSTLGYFQDRQEWERWFPADLIVESLPGQFRNWFYSLLAMSTMLEGRAPVRRVVGYGVVVDERGEEMHKSKGNAIWFSEAADAVGADLVRWLSAAQPLTQPLRFGFGKAGEVRSWLRTLWNVYHFLATYANVDGWPAAGASPSAQHSPEAPLDRWLRARTAAAAEQVADAIESYDPPRATLLLRELLDDLSNWWVRRSRRRFWKGGSGADKEAAYQTLHSALLTFSRLLAPFVPFTAEALYQRLAAPFRDALPESVHLCDFPALAKAEADDDLLAECALARELSRLGRAARAEAGLRVRQPLSRAFVWLAGDRARAELPHFAQDVREELNVRALEFVRDRERLGPAFAEEAGLAVGLDTRLTPDLVEEGVARDLVRHLQSLRKSAGIRVDQRIRLWVQAEGQVKTALEGHRDYIAAETLSVAVNDGAPPPGAPTSQLRLAGARATLALLPCETGEDS
jgi:isoleucyl-tRNA synthetase